MGSIKLYNNSGGSTVIQSGNTGSEHQTVTVPSGNITLLDSNTASSLYGNKGAYNYIIDGQFNFWYEGTTQTTSGYGSDTMWQNINIGSTKTHSQQAFVVGATFPDGTLCPAYYSRTVVSNVAGAGNLVNKNSCIEDVTRLAGKTVTLSFYAKADTNKNIAIELYQSFGSGGSPSSAVSGIGSQLVALTTAWQKFNITVTIPSISGKTLGTTANTSLTYLTFWMDAGSNFNSRTANLGQQSGTFDIANVALVEGSVPFDGNFLPPALEELRVMRYYEFGGATTRNGNRASGTNQGLVISYKVTKRVTPAFSLTRTYATDGWGTYDSGGHRGSDTRNYYLNVIATSAIGSTGVIDCDWKADARM